MASIVLGHNDEHQEDLFEKCFKQITKEQVKEYRISGKSVRMDSKLISSNIAWYSRYEIIHETFVKSVIRMELELIEDQIIRQQALEFFDEDAAKTHARRARPWKATSDAWYRDRLHS